MRDGAGAVYSFLVQCIEGLRQVVSGANPWLLACLWLLFTGWVGMASWAGSLAEQRNRHPLPHFLLGLVVPFLYPFLLQLQHEGGTGVAASAAAPAASPEPAAPVAQAAAAPAPSYDAAFFRRLLAEDRVTAATPIEVTFGGHTLRVVGVVDTLPEVAVLQVIPQAGAGVQRMRVPYARIEAVAAVRSPGAPPSAAPGSS